MALTVNTNVTSLNVQKNLGRASDALSKSMERLSTGKKINTASDDAGGSVTQTKITSQIRGQTVAMKNANDGISIVQTTEGALQESVSILQRMRELAVQSRNDSNSSEGRDALNKEFAQMSLELTRIAQSTNLNGKNLLDGSASTMTFQVGADSGASNQISRCNRLGSVDHQQHPFRSGCCTKPSDQHHLQLAEHQRQRQSGIEPYRRYRLRC